MVGQLCLKFKYIFLGLKLGVIWVSIDLWFVGRKILYIRIYCGLSYLVRWIINGDVVFGGILRLSVKYELMMVGGQEVGDGVVFISREIVVGWELVSCFMYRKQKVDVLVRYVWVCFISRLDCLVRDTKILGLEQLRGDVLGFLFD